MFRRRISLGVVIVYLLLFALTTAMLWVTLDVIINYYVIHEWINHAIVTGNLKHLYDQLSTGHWWEFGRVWLPDIRLSQLLIALLVLPLGSWFAIGLLISAVTNRDDIVFGCSSIIVSILMITIFAYRVIELVICFQILRLASPIIQLQKSPIIKFKSMQSAISIMQTNFSELMGQHSKSMGQHIMSKIKTILS